MAINKKSQSKVRRIFRALNPGTPLKKLLLFVIIFSVLGGGYLLWHSFAYSQVTKPSEPPAAAVYLFTFGCPFNGYGIPPTIKQGSTGPCVRALQQFLYNNHLPGYATGLLKPSGAPDGSFGPWTKFWTVDFQGKYYLVRDGVVGTQTWIKIEQCLNTGSDRTGNLHSCPY